MTPDRVAEALAALEAAVKDETNYKAGIPVGSHSWYRSRELTLRAASALLKLAEIAKGFCAGNINTLPVPYMGRMDEALAELADAVLGPEPEVP
jgi:hypothetical protein